MNENKESKSLLEKIASRPLFAHLSTADDKGPKDSPLWYIWENQSLWMLGHVSENSFIKRIKEDARCAIGIVDFDIETGRVHHLGFRGNAELVPHDESRAKRLFTRYMGEEEQWDPRFSAALGDEQWIFVCFVPETVVVRDQSYMLRGTK
ncbi:pyridoxamine 5'-phosphate oxidase family protein [Alkalicoccobacillus porphyridii]|uniref:Pyridoxamine 5'-phosphate oxidase family protein n=1 Tax=Alkalicoccobacillus porphyridii TaxID=2597270 RepID=A0A553ZZG3_9BACI|nr:pyridoxamine 5'-phosphate oxidase family protein [Alkalicoccobacillus porphyridii]